MQGKTMKRYLEFESLPSGGLVFNEKPNGIFSAPLRLCARYIFVVLCLCVSYHAYAQGLPNPGSVASIGVNIHFTDPAPGEMEQIAAAGFKWVRMDFEWGGIERAVASPQFLWFAERRCCVQPGYRSSNQADLHFGLR